jgi:hypothetical protein
MKRQCRIWKIASMFSSIRILGRYAGPVFTTFFSLTAHIVPSTDAYLGQEMRVFECRALSTSIIFMIVSAILTEALFENNQSKACYFKL